VPDWVAVAGRDPVTVRGMHDPVPVVTVSAELPELKRRSKANQPSFWSVFDGLKLVTRK
jgi:hypothetical protein